MNLQPPCSSNMSLGMDMLIMAPGEVEALDISRALRLELQEQFLQSVPQILSLVDRICLSNESECKVVEALRLLSSWLGQGVTLSSLFEEHNCIFNSLWKGLHTGHEDSIVQCCALLREMLSISEFPRTVMRDRAVMDIVKMFTSSGPSLAPFFAADNSSDNAAHEICSCIASLVCSETALVSAPDTCSVEFCMLLLSCASHRPRKIAALTFDAWLSLQDIPVALRHPLLHKQIYLSLLGALLSHFQYPEGFTSWEAELVDDEDDFTDFRDQRQGAQEVIVVCFYALQGDFFQCLRDWLNGSNSSSWFRLEAALCVLNAVMDSAKKYVTDRRPTDPPVLLLIDVATKVVSLNASTVPVFLVESAARFLGSITFFVVRSPAQCYPSVPDLFFQSLEFLFNVYAADAQSSGLGADAVTISNVKKVAAKSIHQLCVRGSHLFIEDKAHLKVIGLVDMTAQTLSVRCNDVEPATVAGAATSPVATMDAPPTLLLIVEAATRIIATAELDPEFSRSLTAVIGRPITLGLTAEVTSIAPNKAKVELLLGCASQIIKFSDSPKVNQVLLLGDFLTAMWPILEQIFGHSTLGAATGVINQLFGLFSSSMLSARSLVLPMVLTIASAVVSYLQATLSLSQSAVGPAPPQNSAPSVLQCAGALVEALADRSDGTHVLSTLLDQVTETVCNALQCDFQRNRAEKALGTATGAPPPRRLIESDTIEKYFSYVYLYLLLCPEMLPGKPDTLRKVVHILLITLSLHKERGPLRAALQVLQSVFLASTARLAKQQPLLLDIGCESGKDLVNQIIRSLCGEAQSSVVPNLVEGLLSILSGCEDSVHKDDARAWVFSALCDESILSLELISPAEKQIVLTSVFRLILTDTRRCKALLLDFSKICSSESTSDCLLAYEE
jgi:hypothetical protein